MLVIELYTIRKECIVVPWCYTVYAEEFVSLSQRNCPRSSPLKRWSRCMSVRYLEAPTILSPQVQEFLDRRYAT